MMKEENESYYKSLMLPPKPTEEKIIILSKDEKLVLENSLLRNHGMLYPMPKEIEEKVLLKQISLDQILKSLYKQDLIELMRNHCFFKVTSNTDLLRQVLNVSEEESCEKDINSKEE